MRMTYATAISNDGTQIAYGTVGEGPGLILVPGALALARDFDPLAYALADHFTVHTIERRGRGESGDREDAYSIDRECEDVAAVQALTGATNLFGHSFGGLVALEAALRLPAFTKVAVYEPGVSIEGSVPIDWVPRSRKELAGGRGLDAFVTFARGINPTTTGKLPCPLLKLILLASMRKEERRQKYQLLPTALREHVEAARLDGDHHRYSDITSDVLLMAGGKGPTADSAETLARLLPVLPQAHLIVLPRLDHFGPEKEPGEIASSVSAFLRQPAAPAGGGARPRSSRARPPGGAAGCSVAAG